MEESGTIVNPAFMKSLIKCHLMKLHLRKRVFQSNFSFKYLYKVAKWKSQIRSDIEAKKREMVQQQQLQTQQQHNYHQYQQEQHQQLQLYQQQSSDSSENLIECKIEPEQQFTDEPKQEQHVQDMHNHDNVVANVDIMRSNLWLMIVRKEIVPARRRRLNLRQEKLQKTKLAAHRCLSQWNAQSRKQVKNSQPQTNVVIPSWENDQSNYCITKDNDLFDDNQFPPSMKALNEDNKSSHCSEQFHQQQHQRMLVSSINDHPLILGQQEVCAQMKLVTSVPKTLMIDHPTHSRNTQVIHETFIRT